MSSKRVGNHTVVTFGNILSIAIPIEPSASADSPKPKFPAKRQHCRKSGNFLTAEDVERRRNDPNFPF